MALLRGRRGWTLALLLGMSALASTGRAGTAAGEYDLKAAFLLNFARLIEWPSGTFASDAEPFVIGLIGNADVRKLIERRIAGTKIHARAVRVEHLEEGRPAVACHLVFLTTSRGNKARELIAASKQSAVLTVGERDGFTAAGGIISFFEQERKIRFEINHPAAKKAGFRISSRLLNLARIVSHDDSSGL